jgi:hypothetical protein
MLRDTLIIAPLLVLAAACEVSIDDTRATADTDTDTGAGSDADPGADSDADPDADDDADTGSLAACAGLLSGGYDTHGFPTGDVEGELLADGTLLISFVGQVGGLDATGTVDPAGPIRGTYGGVTIDGLYDFSRCEGTGTWVDLVVGTTGGYDLARD